MNNHNSKANFSTLSDDYPNAAKEFEYKKKYSFWQVVDIKILRSTYDDEGEELMYDYETILSGRFGFSFIKRTVTGIRFKRVKRNRCDEIEMKFLNLYPNTAKEFEYQKKYPSWKIVEIKIHRSYYDDIRQEFLYVYETLLESRFIGGTRYKRITGNRIMPVSKSYCDEIESKFSNLKPTNIEQNNTSDQLNRNDKIHAKPSLYALYFYELKEIALKYGYNLVLHGNLNRDLDLIAIPWEIDVKDYKPMIQEFATFLGGYVMEESEQEKLTFALRYHGRYNYVINLNRGGKENNYQDSMYYLDISVISTLSQLIDLAEE